MADPYLYDVFLSHSSRDKPIVRALAERLKNDRLRVWFDEWAIRPGQSIPQRVQQGIEQSRVLLLFMSTQAFASDWATLEYQSNLFLDPTNKDQRFIPIRLDDVAAPILLRQFAYIDWRSASDTEYARLLESVRPASASPVIEVSPPIPEPGNVLIGHQDHVNAIVILPDGRRAVSCSKDKTLRIWDLDTRACLGILEGHEDDVYRVVVTPDGRRAVSCSSDKTLRIWDLNTQACLGTLQGHTSSIFGVAVTPDGRRAVSASADKTLRIWDLDTQACLGTLEGHQETAWFVAITADGRRAVSASADKTLRIWDLDRLTCLGTLEGHHETVWFVAITADGRRAVSSSNDKTLRIWDLHSQTCLATLEGHTSAVRCVRTTADGRRAVSASDDKTIRIWDLHSQTCLATLEGHTSYVFHMVITADGRRAVSVSLDKTVRVWDLDARTCLATFEGHTEYVFNVALTPDGRRAVSASWDMTSRIWNLPAAPKTGDAVADNTRYTNAKILLTGESGVGKTGLAMRLIHDKFEPTVSTDGVWATQLKLPEGPNAEAGIEREVWLWDFAGQADYRLVHQLYMDETAVAVLVFNPQAKSPLEGLSEWDRDLTRAAGDRPFRKLLVAGRCDVGGVRDSGESVRHFLETHGFVGFHETSALTGAGCAGLRQAVLDAIPWDKIPWTVSPRIFKRIKDEILRLKDEGRVLLRQAELKQVLEMRMPNDPFTPDELKAVVGLLVGAGVIWRLDFGGYVLLHPERVNSYAGALVRAVRKQVNEIGCIGEDDVLNGKFEVDAATRLAPDEEPAVLRAMVETLASRGLCLREPSDSGAMLVFPSYYRRDRPVLREHPPPFVAYRFCGSLDEVYTTLVVRLHHTKAFAKDELWRDAADFKTPAGERAGLKLSRLGEAVGEITAYLDPEIPDQVKGIFMRYVHDHLRVAGRATDIERTRFYTCPHCKTPVEGLALVRKKLAEGKRDIPCQECEGRIVLRDLIEEMFPTEAVKTQSRDWERQAQAVIDAESLKLILLGHALSVAAAAGQVFRATPESDQGIDGEIALNDHRGRPSGRRVSLVFKLQQTNVPYPNVMKALYWSYWSIEETRQAKSWREQTDPVMMVVRTVDGTIEWMDVRETLKQMPDLGARPESPFVFQGEPFTAQSLVKLRDRLMPPPKG